MQPQCRAVATTTTRTTTQCTVWRLFLWQPSVCTVLLLSRLPLQSYHSSTPVHTRLDSTCLVSCAFACPNKHSQSEVLNAIAAVCLSVCVSLCLPVCLSVPLSVSVSVPVLVFVWQAKWNLCTWTLSCNNSCKIESDIHSSAALKG